MKCMNLVAALTTLGLLGGPVVTLSQEHNHQKQETQLPKPQDDSKKMSEMMGKPTFEQSADGIHVQVWLVTQEDHKKMMGDRMSARPDKDGTGEMDSTHHEKMDSKMMCGGMSARSDKVGTAEKQGHDTMGMMHGHDKGDKNSQGMDKAMMESMMAGTHHVMVVVSEEETKKEIENAEVEIQIGPPSMKKSHAVELMSMKNHSCAGLVLDEKGEYTIITHVKVGEKFRTTYFQYSVQ